MSRFSVLLAAVLVVACGSSGGGVTPDGGGPPDVADDATSPGPVGCPDDPGPPGGPWVRCGTGLGAQVAYDALETPAGEVYVTGTFATTMTLGGEPITASGPTEAFLAKLDARGQLLWIRAMGTEDGSASLAEDAGHALALLPDGSVAVAGHFTSRAAFGDGITLTGPTSSAPTVPWAFLALYAPDGRCRWARQPNGPVRRQDVHVDAAGDLYVTGHAGLAKYQASGVLLWESAVGSNGSALDAEGNLVLAAPDRIVRLAPDGSELWSTRSFADDHVMFFAAGATADGRLRVEGTATGDVDFGDGVVFQRTDQLPAFVVTYDLAGTPLSVHGHVIGDGPLGFDPEGGLYQAGAFEGALSLGLAGTLRADARSLFFLRYDASGEVASSQVIPTQGASFLTAILGASVTPTGRLVLMGAFAEPMTFGEVAAIPSDPPEHFRPDLWVWLQAAP